MTTEKIKEETKIEINPKMVKLEERVVMDQPHGRMMCPIPEPERRWFKMRARRELD